MVVGDFGDFLVIFGDFWHFWHFSVTFLEFLIIFGVLIVVDVYVGWLVGIAGGYW